MGHGTYFALLAVIAVIAAVLLRLLDPAVRRVAEEHRTGGRTDA